MAHNATSDTPKTPSVAGPPGIARFGSTLLDRKRMEEERLARQGRSFPKQEPSSVTAGMKAHETPRGDTKRQAPLDDDDDDHHRNHEKRRQRLKTEPSERVANGPTASLPSSPGAQYLAGVVRRTRAAGLPQQPDEISIEQVLQKELLELAVISSFQWHDDWLLSKLDLGRTRLLCIAYAADESMKSEIRANAPPNTRFCFPPMFGLGSMHSKLQLLKYSKHLRIVIPTGNMTPYDWGETGVLENMVFVMDLPRLSDRSEFAPTDFSNELLRFLAAMGLDEALLNSLENYDFGQTKPLRFVHTIAGRHGGDDWEKTGYCGLGRLVHSLGLATDDHVNIDFTCSSVGSLNENFLSAMYYACQGDSGTKELQARPAGKKNKGANAFDNRFRVYFPSRKTVQGSRGGLRSAGTICFQRKAWLAPSFPMGVMRDYSSTRPGLLLHTKCMLVRRGHGQDGKPGWAYVGSANLSESAWGKLVKDRQSGLKRLDCRNWECGVILPVSTSGPHDNNDDAMGLFRGTLPLPNRFPGSPYSATGDGSHPWFFHD